MNLTRRQLAEVLMDLLEKYPASAPKKIAAYLIENRRAGELDAIMREVASLRDAKTGRVEITATSAFPLSETVKHEVAKIFGAKQTIFNENIDKSVIGGARFESLDKRLDLTIKHKLEGLRTK